MDRGVIGRTGVSDVIVVGGGTAGAVVAARLVEAGLRVAVIEAGPDYGGYRFGDWPAELLDARVLSESHDWGYRGQGAGGQHLAFERAKLIGGCSAHNGCAQLAGWRGDYDAWAAAGCPGWSGQELRPRFARSIERLRVRHFSPDEIQPFQRGFLEAAVAAGIPLTDDLDDLDGEIGCGPEPMNVVDGSGGTPPSRISTRCGTAASSRSCPTRLWTGCSSRTGRPSASVPGWMGSPVSCART